MSILHLDMDSFFASVEVLDQPALAGLALVVGGSVERGVVASASYAARRYGIRSAMSMAEARRRCPDLVVVRPRHDRYREVSRHLLELLEQVTPLVEPVALDEAYLDVAGALVRGGSAATIAVDLRAEVQAALGLACSVGVGRTKLVAKLASKAAKPRPGPPGTATPPAPAQGPGSGVVVVAPADEVSFLQAHPARALPGVGPRTADKLCRYGVETVGDLALVDRASLVRLLGRAQGTLVHELAHGHDPRQVEPGRAAISIGHEETFTVDERSPERLASLAREMADAVAGRCRANEVAPRRVTVKVRFADFTTRTRSRTLPAAVTTGLELGKVVVCLLAEVPPGPGVRLLGVHASLLVPRDEITVAPEQLSLFAEAAPTAGGQAEAFQRLEVVEAATDAIRRRYGDGAITSLAAAARRAEDA